MSIHRIYSSDIISPPIVISRKMIDPNKDCYKCNDDTFFSNQANDSLEQMEMNTLNREICEKQCPLVSRIPIATPMPIAIAAAIPIPIASAQVIKNGSRVIAKRNKDGTRYLCQLQGGFYYPSVKLGDNDEYIDGYIDFTYISSSDNASNKDKTDTFLITPHTQIGGKSKKKKRNKKRNIKSKSTKKHSRRIKRRRI